MQGWTPEGDQRANSQAAVSVGLVVFSGLLYVCGYSLSKQLIDAYGLIALQVTFLRCVTVLLATAVALPFQVFGLTLKRILKPVRAWEQRAAAGTLVLSNVLAVAAYGLIPVTQASALSFTAPLLLTVMAGVLLHENLSSRRWLAIGIAFAGMLLVVKPSAVHAWIGIAACSGSAATYALYQILVRRLRKVATSLDTTVQMALVGVVLLSATMFNFWRSMGPGAMVLVLVMTIIQTGALASIAAALHRSEASRLAPWQFSGLLWAMLIDAVMLENIPSIISIVGGVLIVFGGIFSLDIKTDLQNECKKH